MIRELEQTNRMKSNAFKLKNGRFGLSIRRKIFTQRVGTRCPEKLSITPGDIQVGGATAHGKEH